MQINKLHLFLPRGDANGDGVKDWDGVQVDAEGVVTGEASIDLGNCFKPANAIQLTCLDADFNADGITDAFRRQNDVLEIGINQLGGPPTTWASTGIAWTTGPSPTDKDNPLAFSDFNGDGYVDLAMKTGGELRIYFHTHTLGAPYLSSNYQSIYTFTSNGYYDTQDVQLYGDMDGNGTPDFVVSNIPSGSDTPGLPTPQYIILTSSQSGGGMTTSTRNVPSYLTAFANGNFFFDLNGDGLQDLISMKIGGVLQYKLNDGEVFESGWTDLGMSLPYRNVEYNTGQSGETEIANYPVMSKLLMMDYDGDGKTEILVADQILAGSCTRINQGPPGGPETFCGDELYLNYQSEPYGALGTPINSSALDNSVRSYTAYSFVENGAGAIVAETPYATNIVASASQTTVVDATGDGLPDVITAFGCRGDSACDFNNSKVSSQGLPTDSTYQSTGAWINRSLGTATNNAANAEFEYAGYDLMKAADDGLGNRHEWIYRPLSSRAYDTTNSAYYEVDHSYDSVNTDPDYFYFASSMNVVAAHSASNGVGSLNETRYRYRGAMYNNKGRGFQGFLSIRAEERIDDVSGTLQNTDTISRTDFYQKWPLSSLVDQSCTFLVADAVQEDTAGCNLAITQTVTDEIHDVASGPGRFVAIKKQTSWAADPISKSTLTTKVTDRSFDNYGNVTYQSASHTDAWTTNLTETTTVFDAPNLAGWWLNKVSSASVTSNPVSARHASSPTPDSGQDAIKTATTTFNSYGVSRMPTSVTSSANDTSLTSTVTTAYNSYGLPTSVSTTATGVATARTVTTDYTKQGTYQAADGYFPFTVTNVLGHQAETHYDPKHGLPVSQWDVNDLQTTTSYDAFGRAEVVTASGAPPQYLARNWCGNVTCPSGAVYRELGRSAGAPDANTYFDSFGRQIAQSQPNYAQTGVIEVEMQYDERGNVIFESVPYDEGAGQVSWTGTYYSDFDVLGRLGRKETYQTNSQTLVTTYGYSGFQTNIDAGGIQMSRTYNGLGQLVQTVDGMGGLTKYAYDGAGNPILMQDPNMIPLGSSIGIKAGFNALGMKEWVSDPDWWNTAMATYGQKVFTYNGLGEVLTESDPNGNLTEMRYDSLGRMHERLFNGWLSGKWHFDDANANKGLGLLSMEDSQFRADGSRLQKFYYYSTTVGGRKDLQQVTHRIYENFDENTFEEFDVAYFTDGYYARPKGMQYPGGTSLAYDYNSHGYLLRERDPLSSVVYREINDRNSRGQIKSASLGLHSGQFQYTQTTGHYYETGQMASTVVSNGSSNVQSLSYGYDVYGNLSTRTRNLGTPVTETLGYDPLQRLTSASRNLSSGTVTVNYGYDAAGNFLLKSDYATLYSYDGARPHVLASVDRVSGGTKTFSHDDNGNLISGDGETITYNEFNKPVAINSTSTSATATFSYGADLMRYRQTTPSGSTIYYIDKLMEIETSGTSTDYRHYLSDVAILTKNGDLNDPSPGIRYLMRDRLGSVTVIGNETGSSVEARSYDAFGKPRNGDWSDRSPAEIGSTVTDRGFTDHEHLDDWQLIHMNGRGYDYNLGRFLSVDPIIQSPGNSQNLNPFVYIFNNPLSGVDPSGYCSGSRLGEDSRSICGGGGLDDESELTISVTTSDDGRKIGIHIEGGNGSDQRKIQSAIGNSLKKEGFSDASDIGSDNVRALSLEERDDGNVPAPGTVVREVPWVMPDLGPAPPAPDPISPSDFKKLQDEYPWAPLPVGEKMKTEVDSILAQPTFYEEADRIWDASVRHEPKRELGALRVYERGGVYYMRSVGNPDPTSATRLHLVPIDRDAGRHVFDWHPHPYGNSQPSPADLKTHGRGRRTGVIFNGQQNTIFRAGCKSICP